MNEIDLLKDLVSFNTIKDKQNKEILDYIEKYLLNLGFKVEMRDKYLIMSIGQNAKLGFIGHSDTVEYIDGWKTNPFELTQKGNILYGLGACDMKGGIAAFLYALSQVDLKRLKYGIKVYITYDEEIDFNGIKAILKTGDKMPNTLIIGEPTDNKIMTGCKGLFAVKIHTNGAKVHSSTPDKGVSANSNMIKLISELEEYYVKNIKCDKVSEFEIPYTTMNIGLLNGGSAINSVAAHCMSYIDFRIAKNEHIDLLKAELNKLCKKYNAIYEIDIELKSFFNDIPFISEKYTAGFMTEASFVTGNRIIYGVGPVTAHEIDEHITVDSFKECILKYKEWIENICVE